MCRKLLDVLIRFCILADRVHERFHDTDEKVRLGAVVSVCEAAAEKIDVIPTKVCYVLKSCYTPGACKI